MIPRYLEVRRILGEPQMQTPTAASGKKGRAARHRVTR
jgi:hypothetical protein